MRVQTDSEVKLSFILPQVQPTGNYMKLENIFDRIKIPTARGDTKLHSSDLI